jgi:DNA polymerase (family X)
MARRLDAARLRQHWKNIDKLAAEVKGITLLKGVEMDILEDGSLDLPDDVLRQADWVVASIHYGQNQSREKITRRLLNAIRNPYVSVIGHPTGRLIGKRKGYEIDLETVLKTAADYGSMMELNCQPSRLDLDDVALMAAREHGIPVVLSTSSTRPWQRSCSVDISRPSHLCWPVNFPVCLALWCPWLWSWLCRSWLLWPWLCWKCLR